MYCCSDESGKNLAVKFLHALDQQRRERFDFECLILSEISHPRVLKVIDVGEVETTLKEPIPFMVTELLNGNLKRAKPLEIERVKDLALQIFDGFHHVHAEGIIHRDIKPGNFLLQKSGRDVVIGDFGLAKTHTDEGRARFYREDLTSNTEQIGPQSFMSPELIRYSRDKSYPVDHRSDIFQIGAVIWYLLTGFPPCGVLRPEDEPTNGHFFPVLEKCMMAKPDLRFQDIAALRAAWEALG